MSFKCQKPKENDFGPMEEGNYEVILKDAKYTQTQSGIPCISFDWVVRNDVEQKYKNKHIFKRYYQDDKGNWPVDKLSKAAYGLGVPEGADFDVDDLVGKTCRVHVKPFTFTDGSGNERTIDSITNYTASENGQLVQTVEKKDDEFVNVEDEELPF